MLEFRLNPYAFYNSNIKTSATDYYNNNALPLVDWPLSWKVTKFSL